MHQGCLEHSRGRLYRKALVCKNLSFLQARVSSDPFSTSFELSEVWHYQSAKFPISSCNDFSYRNCKSLHSKSLRGKKSPTQITQFQTPNTNWPDKDTSHSPKITALTFLKLWVLALFWEEKMLMLWELPPLTWESCVLPSMDILDFATGKASPHSSVQPQVSQAGHQPCWQPQSRSPHKQ